MLFRSTTPAKKVIKPISIPDKNDEDKTANKEKDSKDTEAKSEPEEVDTPEEAEKKAKEKDDDEVNEQLEREKKLQGLINSKKYNVQIKESTTTALKTFIITFLIVLLLGTIVVVGLIDADIIDLGVEIPIDVL